MDRQSSFRRMVYKVPHPIRIAVGYAVLFPIGLAISLIAGLVSGAVQGAWAEVRGFLNAVKRERRG